MFIINDYCDAYLVSTLIFFTNCKSTSTTNFLEKKLKESNKYLYEGSKLSLLIILFVLVFGTFKLHFKH